MNNKVKTEGRKLKNSINPFFVFGKASEISVNLVFFPIILLFFGLIIDKTLNTTPLFIIIGSIAGLFFAIFRAIKIKDQIYKDSGPSKGGQASQNDKKSGSKL